MVIDEKKSGAGRYEICLSGHGGQGIITAAVILARAVGEFNGKYVCQTQSYGPEARGGKSKAEVVISDAAIDYPKAMALDLLLAMNQAACDAYFFDLKSNGLLVVDSSLVDQYPTSRIIPIAFTELARDQIGKEMTANMIALGAVAHLCGQVSPENLKKAMLDSFPAQSGELNLRALHLGINEAKKIDLSALPREIVIEEDEV
ncbi:MAG: 2-oxoacid:acceptor oxidoreductase family protein [Desulfobulbaceae bacterium]|nr:2-oxoacid:acceptor oxidoreductase family protein [Desulfobulbaceae bacterium]